MRGRGPRVEAFPEGARYEDSGCSLFDACLTCPLPACRLDDPQMEVLGRNWDICEQLLTTDLPVPEIARRFGRSTRAIRRIQASLLRAV